MKRKQETEEDFSPEFTAQWRAEGKALYCKELKRLAAEAGLMECPEMLKKIREAEKAAAEAAAQNRHDTRARAREENRQATAGRKGKTQ